MNSRIEPQVNALKIAAALFAPDELINIIITFVVGIRGVIDCRPAKYFKTASQFISRQNA